MNNNKTLRMVQLAILLAIVVVLQCFLGSIVIGTTSFSVVLVPIVIGAIVLGPAAGALLGFVFGLIVLIYGASGKDFFTSLLFNAHPIGTSLICLGKGVVAGWGAGMVYKLLMKKNRYTAAFAAAAAAPILNTGLFILGSLAFVYDTLQSNLALFGADSVVVFLVIGCAGINFIVEFGVNLVLSPAIYTIISQVKRSK